MRSLSLSSFLSSESRSNACIDYAESQKKYSRARTTASLFRRFIFRLGFRSGFTHTKTTKCELASLKQHILLNVFAHKNLFPTSTKCRQIESPQCLTD